MNRNGIEMNVDQMEEAVRLARQIEGLGISVSLTLNGVKREVQKPDYSALTKRTRTRTTPVTPEVQTAIKTQTALSDRISKHQKKLWAQARRYAKKNNVPIMEAKRLLKIQRTPQPAQVTE